MGANRRNIFGKQSRRFSICYCLKDDSEYTTLVDNYLNSKKNCQSGKVGYTLHKENIEKLSMYLNKMQKDFKHG